MMKIKVKNACYHSPKESREQRVELWESIGGDRTSSRVSKDGSEVRSLTESVSKSDRKLVLEL